MGNTASQSVDKDDQSLPPQQKHRDHQQQQQHQPPQERTERERSMSLGSPSMQPLRRASTANSSYAADVARHRAALVGVGGGGGSTREQRSPSRMLRGRSGSLGMGSKPDGDAAGIATSSATAAQASAAAGEAVVASTRRWRGGRGPLGVGGAGPSKLGGASGGGGPTLGFRRKKSIDIEAEDGVSSLTSSRAPSLSRRPPGTISPTLLNIGGFDTSKVVSPYPSPSVATVAQHVSGVPSHLGVPQASGAEIASLPQAMSGVSATAQPPSAGGPLFGGLLGGAGESLSTAAGTPTTTTTTTSGHPRSPPLRADSTESSADAPASRHFGAADPLGRKLPAALPSYLKIPTLIPSAYASPLDSPSSSPTHEFRHDDDDGDDGDDDSRSIDSSRPPAALRETTPTGAMTPAPGAGAAAQAFLSLEDVVLEPGQASKASSPAEERPPMGEVESPSAGAAAAASPIATGQESSGPPSPQTGRTGTDKEEEAAASVGSRLSRRSSEASTSGRPGSRSQTPTPGNMQRLRALTQPPDGAAPGSDAATTTSPEGEGASLRTPPAMQPRSVRGFDVPPPAGGHSRRDLTPDAHEARRGVSTSAALDATPAAASPSTSGAGGGGRGVGSVPGSGRSSLATPGSSGVGAYHHHHSGSSRGQPQHAYASPVPLMPIMVTWRGGGREVFVTGTFANEWRAKILLKKSPGSSRRTGTVHTCVLQLPPGTHRLKFIVDDRWRVSKDLATATDGDGNLVNYVEIPNVGPAHPGPLSAPGEDLPDRAMGLLHAAGGGSGAGSEAGSRFASGASTPLNPVAMVAHPHHYRVGAGAGATLTPSPIGLDRVPRHQQQQPPASPSSPLARPVTVVAPGGTTAATTTNTTAAPGAETTTRTEDETAVASPEASNVPEPTASPDVPGTKGVGATLEPSTTTSTKATVVGNEGTVVGPGVVGGGAAAGLRRDLATLDLQERARRAEAMRKGDLHDVFPDKVRAEERWTQEIPMAIIKAQEAEEAWREEAESRGGGGGGASLDGRPPTSPPSPLPQNHQQQHHPDSPQQRHLRGESAGSQDATAATAAAAAGAQQRKHHHHHHHHHQHHRRDATPPALPVPPTLPRQLEKVILNSSATSGSVDDNSVLPAPNHVVLNHLTASAIKAGVLAVGTTTRYKRKYATIVYHRPVG